MKQKVLEFLLTLPKGKITTYSALSKKFGTHPRAIASFMRSNKFPEKYPCYKVVGKNGNLTGYRLGLDEKKKRLLADAVVLDGEKVKSKFIIQEF